MRSEPPPSLPCAAGATRAATAAPEPPDEPPGVRERSQGFLHAPVSAVSVTGRRPSSEVVVVATTTRPAARRRRPVSESSRATWPSSMRLPQVSGRPARLVERSFPGNGTPVNGPRGSGPAAAARAAPSRRWAMAPSGTPRTATRCSAASTSSPGETSREATSAASAVASSASYSGRSMITVSDLRARLSRLSKRGAKGIGAAAPRSTAARQGRDPPMTRTRHTLDLHQEGVPYHDAVPGALPLARAGALEPRRRRPVGRLRGRKAHGRAGAHGQDERHHRVVRAAGDGDVPARQPPRQRLLGVHVDLVLRGAEARPRAHGVPAPVPAGAGPDGGRAAGGAVRVRSGAGARDAHAALLRRGPPHAVVPPRRRVAHRAGPPARLRPHLRGRGEARRRLPEIHAARGGAVGRRGAGGVREDRRAHGEQRPPREAPPPH